MAETVTRSIDFKGLAQRLYRHLQLDEIARDKLAPIIVNTPPVDCFLETGILKVIIHLVAQPTLEANALFRCTREFLEQVGITTQYEVKIYLVVDETAPIPSQKALASFNTHLALQTAPSPTTSMPAFLTSAKKIQGFETFFAQPQRRRWLLGIGVGVILLGGYALSRPCVLDSCPQISETEQISQSSLVVSRDDPKQSSINWSLLQQQLQQAITVLEPIPPWSRFHRQAQILKTYYQTRLSTLKSLNQVVSQLQQAQQLTQKTPLSLGEGQAAVALWQAAIATLQKLPINTPYPDLIQQQRQIANQGLISAQQRIFLQQQAEQFFQKATEQAMLARIQSSKLQSLGDLTRNAAQWQKVLQSLQQIPPGTTVYDKALKQLAAYSLEYKAVEGRRQLEENAQRTYQSAIAVIKVAEQASLNNQWSIAVAQWQKVIAMLKAIPPQSLVGEKARALLTSASLSQVQAQNYLRVALRSQQIQQQLETLCSQWTRACDYSIGSNVIKVRLTPSYVRQIWDSALQAKVQGNLPGQTGVLNHISHLEQNLQMISNQSGLPLELYHAKGNLLSRYQPMLQP